MRLVDNVEATENGKELFHYGSSKDPVCAWKYLSLEPGSSQNQMHKDNDNFFSQLR